MTVVTKKNETLLLNSQIKSIFYDIRNEIRLIPSIREETTKIALWNINNSTYLIVFGLNNLNIYSEKHYIFITIGLFYFSYAHNEWIYGYIH